MRKNANMAYLLAFPKALRGLCHALTVNEAKHGKGVRFGTVEHELNKAIGHILSHGADAENSEDGCLHLESAISRLAKALEAYKNAE